MPLDRVLKDKDIREPLFDYLEEKFGKIRILEEQRIGRARADLVMVLPEKLCGIEIKSDADSYARLPGQVKHYDRYYDENYIVAGSTHAHHVAEHVPDHWGIITAELMDGRVDFYLFRKAQPNPNAKLKTKLSLLWKSELSHIQAQNKLPKYKNKSKLFIAGKLLEKVPENILQKQISEELFERDYTIYMETVSKSV